MFKKRNLLVKTKDNIGLYLWLKHKITSSLSTNQPQKMFDPAALYFFAKGMVLILDGISEYFAHEWRKIGLLAEQIRFATALDLIKCLKHIKWQRLVCICAPSSGSPSNISTMASGALKLPVDQTINSVRVITNKYLTLLLQKDTRSWYRVKKDWHRLN